MNRVPEAAAKIGLLHHVGGGNLGDDATLDAVVAGIKRRLPNAEIVAFTMNPDDTEWRHGLISHPIRRNRWVIGYKPAETAPRLKETVKLLTRRFRASFYLFKSINTTARLPNQMLRELIFLASSHNTVRSLDLLIITGGGQLTEKDGSWGFPYTIFKWVVLARAAGVRCIFLNVGAGPLDHWLSKFFAKQALLAADYVSLRDEGSRKLVHEIGFTRESRVGPDSVYGLEVATKGSPPPKSTQPKVGFAPMPYPDFDPHGYAAQENQVLYSAFIRKLAIFASWLLDQSYRLTMFGTDIGVDPLAIKDLQMALLSHRDGSSSQYSVNHPVKSAHDLLTTMSEMDYVVTCRFHGVIFAHLLNKPVLAIAHHPKVVDLMTGLELSNYCVDIRHFDPNMLTDRFAALVVNSEAVKHRMAVSLTKNREWLSRQFDELFRDVLTQRRRV
jgi:polysaccharide pyruvyl transferase WcaK-like protein